MTPLSYHIRGKDYYIHTVLSFEYVSQILCVENVTSNAIVLKIGTLIVCLCALCSNEQINLFVN